MFSEILKNKQIVDNNIIPPHLKLWVEEDKLRSSAAIPVFSDETQDFLKLNEDLFRKIIFEKAVKSVKLYPLTYNQKAFWFFQKVNPNNISYNIAIAGKICNPFNLEIFVKALKLLTGRHMLLRTVFVDVKSPQLIPCQVVLDHSTPLIENLDVSSLEPTELNSLLNRKYQIPFNFEAGSLFKTYFFHGKKSTFFLFKIHHILCDAWSLKILLREWFGIYNSLLKGNEPKLKPINFDYGDYIFYQQEILEKEAGKKQIKYWTSLLKDMTNQLILPYDFDRPASQTSNGGTHYFKISDFSFQKLNRIACKLYVTPNVILFTIFELLLSRLSLQKKFNIGILAAARTKQEFVHVFGPFINVLPISCLLDGKKSFKDYIIENKLILNSAFENQDIPFSLLVKNLVRHRDHSYPPVFQVLYNFMTRRTIGPLLDLLNPSSSKSSHFDSLEIYPVNIKDQEGQFDLTLEILHHDSGFLCAFKYNTDLFKQETIANFVSEFNNLINKLINDPEYVPAWLKTPDKIKHTKKRSVKIAGTFTIEPISPYLSFWMKKMNLEPDIKCYDYNQIFQQLIDPNSDFNENNDGFNIAVVRMEDWIKDRYSPIIDPNFSKQIDELESAIFTSSRLNITGKILVAFCPVSYILMNNKILYEHITENEEKLILRLQKIPNVYPVSSSELIKTYSIFDYYEPLGEERGHIPYKESFFISMATILARKIYAFLSLPIKAIAVDCDNTLWQGIVGEIGPKEVFIGDPEKALQKFLIEQYNNGILICLCSKNNANDVLEVFDRNDSMILKREHIAFHRINWKSKSENLISLSEEINIGLDSFVFIDDNPMECEEVKARLPNVLTILNPQNDISATYLSNSWIFDHFNITEEDKVRTKLYKEESDRKHFKLSSISYKDFIYGLNMNFVIEKAQTADIKRISQLTYRTNQFNFTTIRMDESEINILLKNSDYEVYVVNISDRFGDYGIVGVIIINKSETYTIESFLLSCRVLGKGVEYRIISTLGQKAKEMGYDQLFIRFIETEKNIPVQKFLETNFGNYKGFSSDYFLYKIPAAMAIKLKFNPESHIVGEELRNIQDTKNRVSNTNVEIRNNFYYSINEKYLNLKDIRKGIKPFYQKGGQVSGRNFNPNLRETEAKILSVWKEILNNEEISIFDKFFEIGGHSILVPEITIRLQKKYGIRIKIVDVFQYPTVRELAKFVDSRNDIFSPNQILT